MKELQHEFGQGFTCACGVQRSLKPMRDAGGEVVHKWHYRATADQPWTLHQPPCKRR